MASSSARACCLTDSSIPLAYWSLRDGAAAPKAELSIQRTTNEMTVEQRIKQYTGIEIIP